MTKRAYYTDPLVSMYMSREFGVKLEVAYRDSIKRMENGYVDFLDFQCKVEDAPLTLTMRELTGAFCDKFTHDFQIYIHPDSMHIFEPREGDNNITGMVFYAEKTIEEYTHPAGWYQNAGCYGTDARIDMRDKKHFFWPKWEKDDA